MSTSSYDQLIQQSIIEANYLANRRIGDRSRIKIRGGKKHKSQGYVFFIEMKNDRGDVGSISIKKSGKTGDVKIASRRSVYAFDPTRLVESVKGLIPEEDYGTVLGKIPKEKRAMFKRFWCGKAMRVSCFMVNVAIILLILLFVVALFVGGLKFFSSKY
jgi:hypothetical protein